jgi:phasin family protein
MEIAVNFSKSFANPFGDAISDPKEMFTLHQANIEAVFQANTVLAKGFEEIGKHIATVIQVECERAIAAANAASAAKSIPEAITVNADYAKVSLEELAANTTTLRELGIKVVQDAVAPIRARVEVAVEAVAKPVKSTAKADKQAMAAE